MSQNIPATMRAMVLTGYGGLDKLEYRTDLPTPKAGPGEVLIRVGACGLNNTDINTRTGWYSKTVTEGTTAEGGRDGFAGITAEAATWSAGGVTFPHVQGADAVGRIVDVGPGVPESRIGDRVMVDGWVRDPSDMESIEKAKYYGSECWGGYADYAVAPAINAFPVTSDLSDAELATFPCSYSTAENMLVRAGLGQGETVLITGASGGVGSALVQLCKLRDCHIIAIAGASKEAQVRELGAQGFVPRESGDMETAIAEALDGRKLDLAADVVGGEGFKALIHALKAGGRYVTAGAIGGPIAELDLRTLYLMDLTLYGSTVNDRSVFPNLVGYIQEGRIKPLLAKTFPLAQLREAQEAFMTKANVGNIEVVTEGDLVAVGKDFRGGTAAQKAEPPHPVAVDDGLEEEAGG